MIYIIEPHPDDAFMSLHAHITTIWKAFDKTIVTVTGSGERLEEAKAYAVSVGCKHVALGFEDSNWLEPKIPDFSTWGLEASSPEHRLYFPLGLRHPDHRHIAKMAPPEAYYYLDAYYVQGDTNEELVKIHNFLVVSALWASESKRYYLSRFPSQAILFMLAQPNYPPRFELVVK